MIDSQLEIKLIECLGRLDAGEPIDRILAGYPNDAASLRPLLETATALEHLRSAPRETARIASRRAFLAQAHELRETASRPRSWLSRRMLISFTTLVIAFIFLSGVVAASAAALPSEPLYGVKRAVEDARLLVTAGTEKEQLIASLGQRRRDEINMLLIMERDTTIAFEGTIESIRPNGWEVSGLYIYLDQATAISGTPGIGSHTRIQGHTKAGRLLADSISVDSGSSPVLSSTATATAQPSATASPSPTPSRSPSPSPQPQATPQPEATAQPTTSPTSVPPHTPTDLPKPQATSAPPTSAPPIAAPPTNVPPAVAPPTNVPATQESDHSGNSGSDDNSGGGDDNAGDNIRSGGGDDNAGDNSGNGGGGDDHGGENSGSGGGGGGNDNGGGDHDGSDDKP